MPTDEVVSNTLMDELRARGEHHDGDSVERPGKSPRRRAFRAVDRDIYDFLCEKFGTNAVTRTDSIGRTIAVKSEHLKSSVRAIKRASQLPLGLIPSRKRHRSALHRDRQ